MSGCISGAYKTLTKIYSIDWYGCSDRSVLVSCVVTRIFERIDGSLVGEQQDVVWIIALTQGPNLVTNLQQGHPQLDYLDELREIWIITKFLAFRLVWVQRFHLGLLVGSRLNSFLLCLSDLSTTR